MPTSPSTATTSFAEIPMFVLVVSQFACRKETRATRKLARVSDLTSIGDTLLLVDKQQSLTRIRFLTR
jgi:hypothetical protein